jgi:hypothetical protein
VGIRFPPQLIAFALAGMFVMANPDVPRRHHDPPPIAAELGDGPAAWGDRVEGLFPPGSSTESMIGVLRREGFQVEQCQEFMSGGTLTYAAYTWPQSDECDWNLLVDALSDSAGRVQSTRGQVRLVCVDTVSSW